VRAEQPAPPAPSPLDDVLRQAADRTPDPKVRQWLSALLAHGESATGQVGAPAPTREGGGA
jgi:hypothetical protein